IKKDQEILLPYTFTNYNSKLLLSYGFTMPNNPNLAPIDFSFTHNNIDYSIELNSTPSLNNYYLKQFETDNDIITERQSLQLIKNELEKLLSKYPEVFKIKCS